MNWTDEEREARRQRRIDWWGIAIALLWPLPVLFGLWIAGAVKDLMEAWPWW